MKKTLLALLMLLSYSTFASAQGEAVEDTLTSRHPEYQSSLPIGEVVPEITAADTLGNKISLSSYRGKYVVIDFWATWCGDCRREIPFLKKVYAKYKDARINGRQMQWLSVSFDTKAESWKNIVRKEQFAWPQISNLKSTREDETYNNYKLHWIPAFLIVDPDGKLVSTAITADALEKNIQKLLGTSKSY